MTQVGIFGDTIVPQGPEAAEKIVEEAINAAEVEEANEVEVDLPELEHPYPDIAGETTGFAVSTERQDALVENQGALEAADAAGVSGDTVGEEPSPEEVVVENENEVTESVEEADEENEDDESEEEDEPKTAAETIEEIEAAESVEAVDALAAGDERVTVQRAADKRKEELTSDED